MKKMVFVFSIVFTLNVHAQSASGNGWRFKIRQVVVSIMGEKWGDKIFGPLAVNKIEPVLMPEIPKKFKKNTDVSSYTKLSKGPTEFDKLPIDRKRNFDYKFIEELFLVTRKTDARDEDLSSWLNILEQGGSREGIYQALVLDEVYAALESMDEKTSQRLMDFSLHFSQKFLNQTFKKESLEQLNLYSLKRILTEKGLDLMEYYETRDLDELYRWYAIFSADLAKEYGPLLKSQIRQDKSVYYHEQWAKSMPVQHIKSEFIIKLHMIMNGLQLVQ